MMQSLIVALGQVKEFRFAPGLVTRNEIAQMRTPNRHMVLPLMLLAVGFGCTCNADEHGIQTPDDLTLRLVADDDLVPDCSTVCVDDGGSVIASGPGYIRVLTEPNGEGVFALFRTLADKPGHGAHGLTMHDGSLFFVGDNGVWRIDDTDGDGWVDGNPKLVLKIKTGGEHDAHAIRFGDDDHWYLIAGNGTKGSFDLKNKAGQISNPRAGAIWRISSDWQQREVWAHGFRNAYDFDFADDGTLVTFDSDGERDVSLPWYRPTRVYRVRQGDDAGWVSRSWKRPNVDPEMPEVLAELGRGSPTGVLCYRHGRLPKRFHGGFFVLDWTFGRIVFVGLDNHVEVVAEPSGTAGFAVTDIDALPDGRLVVSVGGRRTRGGIYIIDAVQPQSVVKNPAWQVNADARPKSTTRQRIKQLRSAELKRPDAQAARDALEKLLAARTADSQIAAMALMVESVGGLGPGEASDPRGKQQAAAVFDSYRGPFRPDIEKETFDLVVDSLVKIVSTTKERNALWTEAIRTIAVLEPESSSVFSKLVAEMDLCDSFVDKLHCLIALARLPVRRSDEMTEQVANAMIEIPVLVAAQDCNVDRNWTSRLGELFDALAHRDSLVPSRLVSHPEFGDPTHLVWTQRMDPENLERARQILLSRGGEQHPEIAKFIALGNDAVPRGTIRRWLERDETRSAGWIALAKIAKPMDVGQLRKAALSVDKSAREPAIKALEKLGAEVPEVTSGSESVAEWLQKTEQVLEMNGDAKTGKALFTTQQCANCHNGAKALGPSLSGINKRFGVKDLYRATVDPSHTISDRYRAKQILTTDGAMIVGMMIYQSVDGITLLNAESKTIRVNADSIERMQSGKKSLMPEGLLSGLTIQQAADLLAYLRTL